MGMLKFDVCGTHVLISRSDGRWIAFYGGTEGKRRLASDIVIPASTSEEDLRQYLADLCHEWSTNSHPEVTKL